MLATHAPNDHLQLALILGKDTKHNTPTENTVAESVNLISEGDYTKVLLSPMGKALLSTDTVPSEQQQEDVVQNFERTVSNRVSAYLKEGALFGPLSEAADQPLSPETRQAQVLCFGIAALNSFLQTAWTGPELNVDTSELVPSSLSSDRVAELDKNVLAKLSCDGEDAYALTPKPALLAIARAVFLDVAGFETAANSAAVAVAANDNGEDRQEGEENGKTDTLEKVDLGEPRFPDLWSGSWWTARCLFTHQRILENGVSSLHDVTAVHFAKSRSSLPTHIDAKTLSELRGRFEMEDGLFHHYYREDRLAKDRFLAAQAATGLSFNLTGALGKRTKFQMNDVSQLVVLAQSAALEEHEGQGETDGAVPNAMDLNDDTLLEKIEFTAQDQQSESATGYSSAIVKSKGLDPSKQSKLRVIDQSILLAVCLNIKNTNPADGITAEQMAPYVTRVLDNANNWLVHTMALLLRTRLESNKSRTIERACLQLQALVDQIPLEESTPQERLAYFHQLQIPSRWDLERELGERFMSLGAIKSAYEIFVRLQMWEDVISCHQMLGEEEKAEKLVLEQLEKNPESAKLRCILGDIRRDPKEYEKAWEVSGNRYARAMRSLGIYWFHHNDYVKSVEAFEKALALNPLFENSWYVMGCAAMKGEDWENASYAFTRVIALDHENGEAWNNLASVHIHQDRKSDAFHALRMALRQKYDSWRIWQNYLLVALDVYEFAEAVRALSRLIELRWESEGENAIDGECLALIVDALARDMPDVHGRPASKLAVHVENLVRTDIAPRVANRSDIWRILAKFWLWRGQYRESLECQERAYRALVNKPELERDEDCFRTAATAATELVDAYGSLGPRRRSDPEAATGDEVVCKDWAYRSRMILRSLIGRTKNIFEGTETHDQLVETMHELKERAV